MQQENSLIESAKQALESGDLAAFDIALGEGLDGGLSEAQFLHLCIRARQVGWNASALSFLTQYAERRDDASADTYFQLAFETRLTGEHRRAADWLAVALAHPNATYKTTLNYAHMLYASGQFEAANAALRLGAPANEEDTEFGRVMRDFGEYLRNFPLEATSDALTAIKAGGMWRSAEQVERLILDAVADRRPFSMLRLGDGEGAFLSLSEDDEAAYAHLYRASRQNRMAMWFGPTFPWQSNGFYEETQRLGAAFADVDVAAIPDLPWIRNAYKISSHVGIPSLSNVIRFASRKRNGGFTAATIARDLHLKGAYERILGAARRVTIITCLHDLPQVVKRHFRLEAVDLIDIPGEEGSRRALGDNVRFGGHYPDVYNRLCDDLRRPWNGEVVLVAAGILGKLYTHIVRSHGGVALDIGSLADMWLGKKTRPGDSSRFILK